MFTSKNPNFPHDEYSSFDLDPDMSEAGCKAEFRFILRVRSLELARHCEMICAKCDNTIIRIQMKKLAAY